MESLFPAGDDMVVIIDDTPGVWHFRPNLIVIVPYEFFQGVSEVNALGGSLSHVDQPRSARAMAEKRSRQADRLRVPEALQNTIVGQFSGSSALARALTDALLSQLRTLYEWETLAICQRVLADAEQLGVAIETVPVAEWVASIDQLPDQEPETNIIATADLEESARHINAVLEGATLSAEVVQSTTEEGIARDRVVLRILVSEPTHLMTKKYVLERLACVNRVHVAQLMLEVGLGGKLVSILHGRDLQLAYNAIHRRLERKQYKSAALLVILFRILMPAPFWRKVSQAAIFFLLLLVLLLGGGTGFKDGLRCFCTNCFCRCTVFRLFISLSAVCLLPLFPLHFFHCVITTGIAR